jgi:O-acetyl-ADP-ribose deacetylase (regulator of RNase III)
MKIQDKYGDILSTDAKYIAHCVNMQHKMNSGVAKVIRERYPKAYDDYMSSELKLGKVILSKNEPHNILHIVGQRYYGRDGARYIDYPALRSAICTINRNISEPVAFPMIGCGLAGGDWNIVKEILEEEATNFQPIVYILNDNIPY